jgi:hypothetical protein
MATPHCPSCGAPDDGELVHCKFCKAAFSKEIADTAIPCPRCRVANRWGKQKCVACQSWIIVSCVFCGGLSPHNQPACLSCREPFAGAADRKRQREIAVQQQQQQQQIQQYGGVFGNMGAAFVGAAAGVAVADAFSHHHYHHDYGHHPGWDTSSDSFVDDYTEGPPVADDWGGGSGGDDFGGGGDFGGGDFGGGD